MKVNLPNSYRGVLTDERYYEAGEYEVGGAMPPAHAAALVEAGRAVDITPAPKAPPPAPKPTKPAAPRKRASRKKASK
jgi:hypothetical protein